MNRAARRGRWWRTSIRARLALVLSLVLAPVLVLSVVQSVLIFRREASDQRAALVGASERSAASVSARIASAGVLLRSLAPESLGPGCAVRLADIRDRIPGYANLIRFQTDGAVQCAASPSPEDPGRASRPWFRELTGGAPLTVTQDPGASYAGEPTLLASVRIDDDQGRMAGVLTGAITLASLRPEKDDRFVPAGSEVALIDSHGRFLTSSRPAAFPARLAAGFAGAAPGRAVLWQAPDRSGGEREFSAAPLSGEDVYVLISAPHRDVVAWAWVNPLTAIFLPLFAFALALGGVWIVADREVVRWVAYLQRIAAIYARGRYTVHPRRAGWAPPEIRDLAESLDAMASTVAARDRALRDSLVEKDGLLREIHHRVKNNLQVISSLLNLQQRALADPVARAAMSDTRQRIAALALIYRALYEGPDLRKVDLRAFLEDLIAQLILTDSGRGPRVRTHLNIAALTIDPDHLAPLALFAVEAITNARKNGLGEPGGSLSVVFTVHGANAELAITHSGRPDGPAEGATDGVGRTLMLAFARQLGGKAEFRPAPEGGLTAFLRFPAPVIDPPIGP